MIFNSLSGKGFLDQFGFGGKSISQRLTDGVEKQFISQFNKLISDGYSGVGLVDDILAGMGANTNRLSSEFIKSAKAAAKSGKAITKVGTAATKSSLGVKLLSSALNMAVAGLVSWGVTKALDYINNATHQFDVMRDKLQEASDEYTESEQEIKNIESELSTIRSRIDELNSLDSLTFVEQQELDKLKEAAEAAERTASAMGYIAEHKGKETNLAFASLVDSVVSDQYYSDNSSIPSFARPITDQKPNEYTPDGLKYISGRPQFITQSDVDEYNKAVLQSAYESALAFATDDDIFGQNGAISHWVSNAFSNAGTFIMDEAYDEVSWTRENEAYAALEFYKLAKKDIADLNTKIAQEETKETPDAKLLEDYQKQKRVIEEAANGFFNTASDLYEELYNASVQPGVERTAENENAFKTMDALNFAIQSAQLEVGDLTQGDAFKTILSSDAHNAVVDELNKIAEEGNLTLDTIPVDVDTKEFFDACEAIGVSAEQVVDYINAQFDRIEEPKPKAADFSTVVSSLYKNANSENYEVITDAIEEQAEAGKISVETMKALTDISPDFINYLEKTADGYQINTDALMDYIEAQDTLNRVAALNAIGDLQEEFNDAATTDERRQQILSEIEQWKLLIWEIDNATGALAKYQAASETANQDAMHQVGTGIYELIKENRKIGKTGTDDFQAGVEFLLGENWKDDFKGDLDAAYKEAERVGKRYFGQETESDNYINFFNDLVKEGFATKNKLGEFVFENLDIRAIAEEFNMSLDAVRSLFKLAEAYGADFDYDFNVDTTEIEEAQAIVDELYERRDKLQSELAHTKEGTQEHEKIQTQIAELDSDITTAEQNVQALEGETTYTLDEAIAKIKELEALITSLSNMGFDIPVTLSGEYDAITGFFNSVTDKVTNEDGEVVGYKLEVDGVEDALTKVEQIENYITSIKNDPNVPLSIKATLENIAESTIAALNSFVETGGGEATFVLAAEDNVTPAVDAIRADDPNNPNKVIITITDNGTAQAVSDKIDSIVNPKTPYEATYTTNAEEAAKNANDLLDSAAKDRPVKFIPKVEPGTELGYTNKDGGQATGITDPQLANMLVAGSGMLAEKNENGVYETVDMASYFADLTKEIHEATGKIPTAEQVHAAYKNALETSEIAFNTDEKETNPLDYAKRAVSDYQGTFSVDQTFNAETEVGLSTDDASEKVEKLEDQIQNIGENQVKLDISSVVGNAGDDVDSLNDSADALIQMAESSGVAKDNQEALKASVEALNAAYANLQTADPYDATAVQSASMQLNDAVTNYKDAYNTLASDLMSIDPVNVTANISSAQRSINSLNGKVVTITVKTNTISTTVAGQPVTSGSTGTTGTKNASGTTFARGGTSLVDEEGAELIEHVSEGTYELGTNKGPRFTKLNKGDIVHTASETKKILSRMGGAIGGFFRDGLNKTKSVIGKAFASGTTIKMPVAFDIPIQPVAKDTLKSETVNGTASSKPGSSSSSSNKKGSSSSSSSSSKKSAKNLDDFLAQLFDWIEVRLARLQDQTDGWLAQVAEAVGYVAKNAKLDNALTSVSKQIEANTKGYAKYMEAAEKIADKFDIDPELIKLIQEGEIEIAKYDEDTQKKIKAYQEWYDKAIECKQAIIDLKEQEKELATQKLDSIIDHFQWRVDRYDAVTSRKDAELELKKATGQSISINDYGDSVLANTNKQVYLEQERNTLAKEFESLVESGYITKGSEEWYEYTAQLEELDEAIIQNKIDLVELQDAAANVSLTNLQYALASIERSAAGIHQIMNLHEAQGIDHVAQDYEKLIRNGMAHIENLKEQNKELKKQQEGLDKNSEKWQEIQEQIDANNQSISDMMVSQEQWNDAVLDLEIQKLQEYRDTLSKTNDNYQNQLNLQQAIEDLERSKSQRTQRVFRDGIGFVYESDQEAVKDAQNAFDQELNNQMLGKLDELIEAVEDSKSDVNVYDSNGVLLGEKYTLPGAIDYSELLGNYGASSIVDSAMEEAKKAAVQMVLNGVTTGNDGLSLKIGDIVIQGVDNPNSLAEALLDQFPNALIQALYKK